MKTITNTLPITQEMKDHIKKLYSESPETALQQLIAELKEKNNKEQSE